jgi:hypothetical protein
MAKDDGSIGLRAASFEVVDQPLDGFTCAPAARDDFLRVFIPSVHHKNSRDD